MRQLKTLRDTSGTGPVPAGAATFNPERLAIARGGTAIVVCSICIGVFGILYSVVRRNRSQAVDAAITLKVQGQKSAFLDRLLHVVSWPGFPPQSRILPPAISAALWILGFRLESVFQLLGWGTGVISFTVKRSIRRPRPEATAAETAIKVVAANIGGSSFPSGHVLNYLGVYGFLAFLANAWIRPKALRRVLVGALVSLIGLVGPSRVYLGHHWFTDVTASYMLGTTYLIGLTTIYRKVRIRISTR